MEELKAQNIDLYLKQQNIDTTTPAGKAMFQMVGVFAEFERSMIQERVNAGLARAKAQGKTLGRPKLDTEIIESIRADRAKGMTLRMLKDKHNVSLGAIHKAVQWADTEEVLKSEKLQALDIEGLRLALLNSGALWIGLNL